MHDRTGLFVLTGGPGAGKTTLVDALADRGYATAPEAGRGVIRAQSTIDGPALPWKDPAAFADAMLGWDMRSHAAAIGRPRPVFFDRGVPDIAGYLRLTGLPVPPHVHSATQRFAYDSRVFVLPFWPEIYEQDAERGQSPGEARRTFEIMANVYRELGHDLIEVPRVDVARRVEFVLERALLAP